jgi:hypothetical protein
MSLDDAIGLAITVLVTFTVAVIVSVDRASMASLCRWARDARLCRHLVIAGKVAARHVAHLARRIAPDAARLAGAVAILAAGLAFGRLLAAMPPPSPDLAAYRSDFTRLPGGPRP